VHRPRGAKPRELNGTLTAFKELNVRLLPLPRQLKIDNLGHTNILVRWAIFGCILLGAENGYGRAECLGRPVDTSAHARRKGFRFWPAVFESKRVIYFCGNVVVDIAR
jgi:hypothetical protein